MPEGQQILSMKVIAAHLARLQSFAAARDFKIEDHSFLDSLNIEHDGRGCSDRFPAEVEEKPLQGAMNTLLQGDDPEAAAFYLKIFPDISGTQWKSYPAVLEKVVDSSKQVS